MNLQIKNNGFSLVSDSVSFDFDGTAYPDAETFRLNICGSIPVPDTKTNDRILLPIDEGLAITADKEYESGEFDCNFIKGGFCGREGTLGMLILERCGKYLLIKIDDTANSHYCTERINGLYKLSIYCDKATAVQYKIFNSLTEACKFYRSTTNKVSVILNEKIKGNSELNKLVGGGIFWIWNDNYDKVMYSDHDTDSSPAVGDDLLIIADDLYKSGIDNAMLGIFFNEDSEAVEQLYKEYGYICTQYDNYNDVLNPELLKIVPNNRVKNCGYTFRRMKDYPDGVAVTSENELAEAWALKGFDGKMHSQNSLCPIVAHERMKSEIPLILNDYPYYKGRFIDVFGNGLQECFSKEHPLSLEECKSVKSNAFKSLKEMGLIIGTEDLIEDIMDNIDYSEGLHSPVYFRIHDAGRNHAHIYNENQAEHIKKHMLNPECRVPLWQLVYHECLIAFPYWGDSTEMLPDMICDKILFACLYGSAPLYSFSVKDYQKLKPVILSSYKKITTVHKTVAELPMTDFNILNADYTLQRTVFGNKYEVIANFADKDVEYKGKTIPAKDIFFGETEG